MRRSILLAAAVSSSALLAACGTTAPLSSQRSLSAGGGLGSGSAGAQSVGGLGASSGSSGISSDSSATSAGSSVISSGLGGASPGTGGSATTAATGVPAMSGSAGPQPGDGPGVTATTINIAGVYDPDASAADSALGLANANPGDTKAQTDAIVSYINAHGGIAGRKVNIVWYMLSVQNNAAQSAQAACATWTQDNKIFVQFDDNPILDQCTANAHGVGISSGLVAETTPALQQFPSDVNLDGFTIDRGDKVTIDGLGQQGYFSPGAKVGVVTWDENDYRYGTTAGGAGGAVAIETSPGS